MTGIIISSLRVSGRYYSSKATLLFGTFARNAGRRYNSGLRKLHSSAGDLAMSTVRKVDPAEAADWDLDLAPFVLEAMLDRNAGADRTGLTRIDRRGADGGEHAWRA